MKYSEFRSRVSHYPFFRSNILDHLTDDVPTLRNQLVDWVQKGYVIQLKRGLYTLCEADRAVSVSRYLLANNIYLPSYISMESALSYYGLIPEAVYAVTSISTKKTQRFENTYGSFLYRHLKPSFYDDFVSVKDEFGAIFLIASKEKALIDFLYFKMKVIKKLEVDIFLGSYRLQNLNTIDRERLSAMAHKYQSKKLRLFVNLLLEKIGEDR